MKPLYTLTDKNKETYFDLLIYDILDKIDIRCKKWVEGVFINIVVPEEIETDNLFSEAIWLISLAENFNYNLDSKQFADSLYSEYTAEKEGFKNLINNSEYNKKEHRLYTEEEKKVNREKANKIAMEILNNLD